VQDNKIENKASLKFKPDFVASKEFRKEMNKVHHSREFKFKPNEGSIDEEVVEQVPC